MEGKSSKTTKAFLYAFSLAAITYAGWQLEAVSPTVSASGPGKCCSFGNQCDGTLICCRPTTTSTCSNDDPGNCLPTCT